MVEFLIIGMTGLITGSFLNVCIYRIPLSQSVVYPFSYCPHCRRCLKPVELIPLLSYVALGRRCRQCGGVIAFRYPLVELLTAVLFTICFSAFGWTGRTVAACMLASFMLVIAYIDFEHQLIFDNVLSWFSLTGIIAGVWLDSFSILNTGAAVVSGGGLLLLIAILSRGGIGDGDVKLGAALGCWLGWPDILLALFFAFILGGLVGSILLLFRLKGRKDTIPFGPFICLGAFVTFLYGSKLLFWYCRLLG